MRSQGSRLVLTIQEFEQTIDRIVGQRRCSIARERATCHCDDYTWRTGGRAESETGSAGQCRSTTSDDRADVGLHRGHLPRLIHLLLIKEPCAER